MREAELESLEGYSAVTPTGCSKLESLPPPRFWESERVGRLEDITRYAASIILVVLAVLVGVLLVVAGVRLLEPM